MQNDIVTIKEVDYMAQAKTINLLLNDGTLKGVISMDDSSWNKGELYSAPRESVQELLSSDACVRYGVYLLLSEDMVYIGQASDLARRIKQHIMGKSWWERVVILTTSDDSLNRSDIDYIEASLIAKASTVGRLDCDNKTQGNKQKVGRFREVSLDQYIDEALFLLELVGINVFSENFKAIQKTKLISTVKNSSKEQVEIREKREALLFLSENGITVEKNANYAKRQDTRPLFWLNPNVVVLEKDWDLILNDQFKNEIVIIHIPAHTFSMRTVESVGLIPRHDRPNRIDLEIAADTLVDQRSKCDFSNCQITRIKY